MPYGGWAHHTTKQPLPEACFIVPLVGLGWWWLALVGRRAKSDVHYALAKPIPSFHTEVVVCRVQDPIKSGDIGSIQNFGHRHVAHLIFNLQSL